MRAKFLCFLAVALTACARSECPPDLEAAGLAEGREGQLPSLPNPGCRLRGERLLAYELAYRQGLSGYCTGPRGWIEGQRGRRDPSPCREQEHPDFVQAMRLGAEYAAFATEVETLRREIETRSGEAQDEAIRRIQRALSEMEAIRGVATVRGWNAAAAGERAR